MIGHELHRSGSFWSFLLSIDKDLADSSSAERMLVRWSPPLRQLPAGTAGRAGSSAGGVSLPVQLLLRSRRLQKEDDAAIGPFSRQKGLPWCRGDLDQRHAARSNAAPSPRAFDPVWC